MVIKDSVMSDFKLYDEMARKLSQSLSDSAANATDVISQFSTLIGVVFVTYILLLLWRYIKQGDAFITDFPIKLLAWCMILALALNARNYESVVIDFFEGASTHLPGVTIQFSDLDQVATVYIEKAIDLYNSADGIEEIIMVAMSISLSFVAIFSLLSVFSAFLLISKTALFFLMSLGPLFILAALFPVSRRFFESWIGRSVYYLLWSICFNFLCKAALAGVDDILIKDLQSDGLTLTIVAQTIALCVLFSIVSFNLNKMISVLGDGIRLARPANSY
jgi:type IV secretion system protein VirB6